MSIFETQEWKIVVRHLGLAHQLGYIIREGSPDTYLFYLALPVYTAMAIGFGYGTKWVASFGWDAKSPFVLAVAVMAALGVAFMARDVVYGTALALWSMNWLSKLLTLGIVGRILLWWFGPYKGWDAFLSFPFLDALAAFTASASAEVFWRERRFKRKHDIDDEPPDYDEFTS